MTTTPTRAIPLATAPDTQRALILGNPTPMPIPTTIAANPISADGDTPLFSPPAAIPPVALGGGRNPVYSGSPPNT